MLKSTHHVIIGPLAQAGENAPWLAGEAMRMASEVAGRFWETATWAVRRRGRGKLESQKIGKSHEKTMGKTMRPWETMGKAVRKAMRNFKFPWFAIHCRHDRHVPLIFGSQIAERPGPRARYLRSR